MDDEILQHHFDEVFSALQDRENFEIFTKIKPVETPKIKRTFFKIVTRSQMNSNASIDEMGMLERSPRRYSSQNNFKLSPYNSRPSSASTTTVKARATIKPIQRPLSPKQSLPRPASPRLSTTRPTSPRPFSRGSSSRTISSRTLSRPLSPPSMTSNSKYSTVREYGSDSLLECGYCGRYFLGKHLNLHEEMCKRDYFST